MTSDSVSVCAIYFGDQHEFVYPSLDCFREICFYNNADLNKKFTHYKYLIFLTDELTHTTVERHGIVTIPTHSMGFVIAASRISRRVINGVLLRHPLERPPVASTLFPFIRAVKPNKPSHRFACDDRFFGYENSPQEGTKKVLRTRKASLENAEARSASWRYRALCMKNPFGSNAINKALREPEILLDLRMTH